MPIDLVQQLGLDNVNYDVLTTKANGIPYLESLALRERWAADNIETTRTVFCLWEDRYQLVADFLGTSVHSPGNRHNGVQTNIKRYIPEAHPELDWQYASSMEMADTWGVPGELSKARTLIEALQAAPGYGNRRIMRDANSNMVRFSIAQYTVNYTPRDYDIVKDDSQGGDGRGELNRYISRFWVPSGSNQPVPGSYFKFASDNEFIRENPAITIPVQEVRYLWREVPLYDQQAILDAIGKCNATAFEGYGPQTLLCDAPKINKYRTPTGNNTFNIEFIFIYRAKGWNTLLRRKVPANGNPDAGKQPGFDRVIGIDGTTPLTYTTDFFRLFKLP